MPTETGQPIVYPEPKLGRIKPPIPAAGKEAGDRLLKWNTDMQRACRGLKPTEPLPAGFERLRILPRMWWRGEEQFLSDGTPHKHGKNFPEARNIMLEFPHDISVVGGSMKSKPVVKTMHLPGRTTAGAHITSGYTAEDCARAIIRDPNWCFSYVVQPMSEEEDARESGLANSEEFIDKVQHRKELMQEAEGQNFNSTKYGAQIAMATAE